MIKLKIDGKAVEARENETVLSAACGADIYIPHLCYHPDISPIGACRLCLVEIEGVKGFPAACTTRVEEAMVVHTDTPELRRLRKNNVWLILSEYPSERDKDSQLAKVIDWVGTKELRAAYIPHSRALPCISEEPLFIRDMNRCILCARCQRICREVRGVGVIGLINRGTATIVGTNYEVSFKDADCKFCGACVEVCPTGALQDKESFDAKDRERVLLPCENSCPAGIEVWRYVRLIAEKRFQDALEVIRERVPFPHVLGWVCHHPCEEACRRGEVNEPIAIKGLKRFLAEADSGRWRSKVTVAPATGKKVAIIGSGPAGLTAGWFLKRLGHSVTVFEALPQAGGMMRSGIPRFRLPREILDREIKEIENFGVELKVNTKIESLDKLSSQGFQAILLALGAGASKKMALAGADDRRVLDGIGVLADINLGRTIDIKGDVGVVGGGNVALDAARCALRSGARKVTVFYRRTQEEMPAASEEIEEALEEGIEFSFLTLPQRLLNGPDKLKVECVRMKLGAADSSGRRRPIQVAGSKFTVELDKLIMAIGQEPAVPESFNLDIDQRNCLKVDRETFACSRKGVFAAGDLVTGPASVIEAIQGGRLAAASIDKYLGGQGKIDQRFVPPESEDTWIGREKGFAYRKRADAPKLSGAKRVKGFSPVEVGLDEKMALSEADRCLRCQLRLKISPSALPPQSRQK
jgi:NADPH-dependent glutamate synthase beta subunit-like oxidoreductase/NAD-dependent dihydropyrimidine dehydrogenase PreA subunit